MNENNPEFRKRMFLVHASSLAAVIFTNVFVLTWYNLVSWKRHEEVFHRKLALQARLIPDGYKYESPTPHTIWTRPDLLFNDENLRREKKDISVKRSIDANREHLNSLKREVKLSEIKRSALQLYEKLGSINSNLA